MTKEREALVCKSTGSWYIVRDDEGKEWKARARGRFRLQAKGLSNPIAVGDRVRIQSEEEDIATIYEILPRRNYVLRQSPQNRHKLHVLAANIDQAVLVLSIRQPRIKLNFIDRFLLSVEPYKIPTLLVVNKADLHDEEDQAMFLGFRALYQSIGYECLQVSATQAHGLEPLRQALQGKRSLFSGHSGVGKSSLLNALAPELDLRTGDISDYSGKGKHTTTFAELHKISEFQAEIIDSPGIKELGFIHLNPQDIAHNFREFFALSSQCRYANCLHLQEPGCAIKAGLEDGRINELRYQSYLSIMEEVRAQDSWEQRRDL